MKSIFDGDGRHRVEPINAPEDTLPIPVTRSQARRLIDMFANGGESFHSSHGNTVWVIVTHCLEREIRFEVSRQHHNGKIAGFAVHRR